MVVFVFVFKAKKAKGHGKLEARGDLGKGLVNGRMVPQDGKGVVEYRFEGYDAHVWSTAQQTLSITVSSSKAGSELSGYKEWEECLLDERK